MNENTFKLMIAELPDDSPRKHMTDKGFEAIVRACEPVIQQLEQPLVKILTNA